MELLLHHLRFAGTLAPMKPSSSAIDGVKGAQSVHRAIAVLRVVATSGEAGAQPANIARELGLSVATTHRLVATLVQEAMIERSPTTKRYRIGPELVALGSTFDRRTLLRERLNPTLRQLAKISGDSVFLHLRSGRFATCVAREEGSFPIRAMTVDVGSRRPLGVGAGPLAVLAFLPEAERASTIAGNASRFSEYGLTAQAVQTMADRAVSLGYALNDGRILPDMTAIAVPIHTTHDRVIGSVSIAAINSRMEPKRRDSLAALLRREIGRLTPLPE